MRSNEFTSSSPTPPWTQCRYKYFHVRVIAYICIGARDSGGVHELVAAHLQIKSNRHNCFRQTVGIKKKIRTRTKKGAGTAHLARAVGTIPECCCASCYC